MYSVINHGRLRRTPNAQKTYLIVVGGIDYEGKSFEGTLPQEYDKWLTALDAMDKFAERINKEKE